MWRCWRPPWSRLTVSSFEILSADTNAPGSLHSQFDTITTGGIRQVDNRESTIYGTQALS
jgi:hypothetical protein